MRVDLEEGTGTAAAEGSGGGAVAVVVEGCAEEEAIMVRVERAVEGTGARLDVVVEVLAGRVVGTAVGGRLPGRGSRLGRVFISLA